MIFVVFAGIVEVTLGFTLAVFFVVVIFVVAINVDAINLVVEVTEVVQQDVAVQIIVGELLAAVLDEVDGPLA